MNIEKTEQRKLTMYALECVANQPANVEDLQVLATFLVWDGLNPKAFVSNYTHKNYKKLNH